MSEYTPDRWKLVKITNSSSKVHYRIFATWGGSYMYGSSWKMSSGCTPDSEQVDGVWNLPQSSGSTYRIRPESEGICGGWNGVLKTYNEEMESYGGKLEIIDSPDFYKLKEEFV
jgi:hypothetical protein